MLAFLAGLALGSLMGVWATCIVVVGRKGER